MLPGVLWTVGSQQRLPIEDEPWVAMVPASSFSLPSMCLLGQVPSHLAPVEWLPETPLSLPGVLAQPPAPCVGAPGLEGPPWMLPPTAQPGLLSEQFPLGEGRGSPRFNTTNRRDTGGSWGPRLLRLHF